MCKTTNYDIETVTQIKLTTIWPKKANYQPISIVNQILVHLYIQYWYTVTQVAK